jgi:hypothetical protein
MFQQETMVIPRPRHKGRDRGYFRMQRFRSIKKRAKAASLSGMLSKSHVPPGKRRRRGPLVA